MTLKRVILPALVLALLLAVPAIPQGGDAGLAKKVDDLSKVVAEQQTQIQSLDSYVKTLKKQSAALSRKLAAAESGGFLYPAPNTEARKALLKGLQDFAGAAASGKVKQAAADEE